MGFSFNSVLPINLVTSKHAVLPFLLGCLDLGWPNRSNLSGDKLTLGGDIKLTNSWFTALTWLRICILNISIAFNQILWESSLDYMALHFNVGNTYLIGNEFRQNNCVIYVLELLIQFIQHQKQTTGHETEARYLLWLPVTREHFYSIQMLQIC